MLREIRENDDSNEDEIEEHYITAKERDKIIDEYHGDISKFKKSYESKDESKEDEIDEKIERSNISKRLLTPEERDRIVQEYHRKVLTSQETEFDSEQEIIESKSVKRVKMFTPSIRGEEMKSINQIMKRISETNPEFYERQDSERLLQDVKTHFLLHEKYSDMRSLPRGEIAAISKEYGKSISVVKRWLLEEAKPKFYYYVNRIGESKRDAHIEAFLSSLNGIVDTKTMKNRLASLYYYDEIQKLKTHDKRQEYASRFFKFLECYSKGNLITGISREHGIGKTTINEWIKQKQLPTDVKLASFIPSEYPKNELKWLPLRINTISNTPEQFIKVPLEIHTPEDIRLVLTQVSEGSLENQIDFMYLLGLLVSDGGFPSDVSYSARLSLWASKKYNWSQELGDSFCEIITRLGFSANQRADSERIIEGKHREFRNWASEASPFFMWMKKSLLGLESSETKKETPINADWILQMPYDWRVAFLQGVNDGDGHASIRSFNTSIATVTNHDFFKRLLESLDITASIEETKVRVRQYDEIQRAGKLPFFRYAEGRQKRLDDLCKVITKLDTTHGPIPREQLDIMMELKSQGRTAGEISEQLWYDYGIARSYSSINMLFWREKKKQIKKE